MSETKTKKIAECVNVLVNVDRFEHIEITKYSETTISYDSAEEMVQKEEQHTAELLDNVVRTMRKIPAHIGLDEQKAEHVKMIEEKISKKVPKWLKDDPVPNIANKAIKSNEKAIGKNETLIEEQEAKAVKEVKLDEELFEDTAKATEAPEAPESSAASSEEVANDDDDLFEDTSKEKEEVKEDVEEESKTEEIKEESKEEDSELFDDDLFENT